MDIDSVSDTINAMKKGRDAWNTPLNILITLYRVLAGKTLKAVRNNQHFAAIPFTHILFAVLRVSPDPGP
ncbi:hypothetical protein [Burkholderia ubonensis]|uniref:hypothetical protein n=2 Tax=Burkholderia ubonensis TaxID=101571 RepID=UPI0012F72D04|nr:hypothetical protein [Burkholderia ubonensis]